MNEETLTGVEYWDARYRTSEQMWSGQPNAALVREAGELPPATALDLGCGEGGDAIWLARRGWRVTAVDISQVALDRAAKHAEEAGVGDRIEWQQVDLATSFPEGDYGLVSAQFFHSWVDLPRERILRRATEAVAPGGSLLVVGHGGFAHWEHEHQHQDVHFPSPEEVLASLELDERWEVRVCGEHERVQTGPDGEEGTRTDNAVMVTRAG